mmetsp:Transcript_27090/g.65855  ORF Transcript_27090/g.65855 Transcript_27090/m.65855 type:complete len:199 (-) Transcript_27090:621-1217(-)
MVEFSLVQKEENRDVNLVAMVVVDTFTYSYVLSYTVTAVTNENVAKLVIATLCFVIHWTANLIGFLLKPDCPLKQAICTFVAISGTVLVLGLIFITILEVRAMGWRYFLSLGTDVSVMKILRSYQAYLAASQLCLLLLFNAMFLSTVGLAQYQHLPRARFPVILSMCGLLFFIEIGSIVVSTQVASVFHTVVRLDDYR